MVRVMSSKYFIYHSNLERKETKKKQRKNDPVTHVVQIFKLSGVKYSVYSIHFFSSLSAAHLNIQ